MRRRGEVSLLMTFTVATQAAGVGVLLRHRLEANDLGYIPAAFHVGSSWTVTGFAAVPVFQGGLEVWSVFEVLLVQLLVAGLTGINTNVLRCPLVGRCGILFLLAGSKVWLNQQQQQDCRRSRLLKSIPHSFRCHGLTSHFATGTAMVCSAPL